MTKQKNTGLLGKTLAFLPSASTLAFNAIPLSYVLRLPVLCDRPVLKYTLKKHSFEHRDLSLCLHLHLAVADITIYILWF